MSDQWASPTGDPQATEQAGNEQANYSYDPNYAAQYYSYYDPTYYQYYQQYYQSGGVQTPETPTTAPTTPTTPTTPISLAANSLSGNPISSNPSPAEIANCKSLYVGNISPNVNEQLLYEIFSTVGTVESCKLIKDNTTGYSAGYGFVVCADHATAFMAIQHFNGRLVYGQEMKVNWAFQSGQKEDTSNHYHIFVGDLSPEIDDKTLHDAFSAFGPLSAARVMKDTATGRTRGYGFVAFRQKDDAERALSAMNGEWLGSRPIRCNWANNKGVPGLDAKHQQMSGLSTPQPTIGPQMPPHLQVQYEFV
jgi:nucleolysin TIA-1/TIAR